MQNCEQCTTLRGEGGYVSARMDHQRWPNTWGPSCRATKGARGISARQRPQRDIYIDRLSACIFTLIWKLFSESTSVNKWGPSFSLGSVLGMSLVFCNNIFPSFGKDIDAVGSRCHPQCCLMVLLRLRDNELLILLLSFIENVYMQCPVVPE